jgi:chemotaxis protein methyltransferase CheR
MAIRGRCGFAMSRQCAYADCVRWKPSVKALFDKIEDARQLAQIVVESVHEPLLVLDGALKILVASGSFLRAFQLTAEETENRQLFALDNAAWDIPALRVLLERIIPEHTVMEGFEVAHAFPRIGERVFLLHARKALLAEGNDRTIILLGFEDVTVRRGIEREKELLQTRTDELLAQKQTLLEEMQHRIVNSLQIIASILMLKARAVTSEETRQHLQDAHRRVMSVAAVQKHLHTSGRTDLIEIAPYLTKLCSSLSESMIGDNNPAVLIANADSGALVSADAVSLGLIVTELVINALKYAFPDGRKSATVTVRYEVNGADWKLSVSDNGVGHAGDGSAARKGGLGTSLVNALAHQLDAQVKQTSSAGGLSVAITHATFTSLAPLAA